MTKNDYNIYTLEMEHEMDQQSDHKYVNTSEKEKRIYGFTDNL